MGWLGDEIEKIIPRLLVAKYVMLKEAKTKAKFLVLNEENCRVRGREGAGVTVVGEAHSDIGLSLVKMSVVFLMMNLMIQPFF